MRRPSSSEVEDGDLAFVRIVNDLRKLWKQISFGELTCFDEQGCVLFVFLWTISFEPYLNCFH